MMTGSEFHPRPSTPWVRWLVAAALLVVTFPALAIGVWIFWVPPVLRYEVDGTTLQVTAGRRPFLKHRSVELGEIAGAEPTDGLQCHRQAGERLPGYCEGRFTCIDIGTVWMAGTCRGRDVVLRFRDGRRPWVLSPSDRDAFLAALGGETPLTDTPPPPQWPWWIGLLRILMPLGLVLGLAVPGMALLGPVRLSYTVGPGGVEVRTAFRRRTFPIAGATARAIQGTLGARLAGISLPGYHAGWYWFRGGKARVYTGHVRGCFVLLETGGTRVVLDPADPAAFLDTLASFGASVDPSGTDPCARTAAG